MSMNVFLLLAALPEQAPRAMSPTTGA